MRVAVVGAGVVGLAAAAELMRAGHDVRCFEADRVMGARSAGDSRVFRLAHRRADLVELAATARERWARWSERAGERLVGDEGTVVSGDVHACAAAMERAGARFELRDTMPSLPAAAPVGPFLHDPAGGVIRAARAGAFLAGVLGDRVIRARVARVETAGAGVVLTFEGGERVPVDAALVAAGRGTPDLVAPLGVEVPRRVVQHVRLTFPLRDPASTPPCWLDDAAAWRPGVSTYGQLASPGRWAIGADGGASDPGPDVPVGQVERQARELLLAYVREYVTGCEPVVVDSIHCDSAGLGDGVHAAVTGSVTVAWGDNLFKLAPVVGELLARAVVARDLPPQLRSTPADTAR